MCGQLLFVMRVKYNDVWLGEFPIPFRDFRKLAVKLKLKYMSLDEGGWVEVWGKEDSDKLQMKLR